MKTTTENLDNFLALGMGIFMITVLVLLILLFKKHSKNNDNEKN